MERTGPIPFSYWKQLYKSVSQSGIVYWIQSIASFVVEIFFLSCKCGKTPSFGRWCKYWLIGHTYPSIEDTSWDSQGVICHMPISCPVYGLSVIKKCRKKKTPLSLNTLNNCPSTPLWNNWRVLPQDNSAQKQEKKYYSSYWQQLKKTIPHHRIYPSPSTIRLFLERLSFLFRMDWIVCSVCKEPRVKHFFHKWGNFNATHIKTKLKQCFGLTTWYLEQQLTDKDLLQLWSWRVYTSSWLWCWY